VKNYRLFRAFAAGEARHAPAKPGSPDEVRRKRAFQYRIVKNQQRLDLEVLQIKWVKATER
jgi:hypothetical protein